MASSFDLIDCGVSQGVGILGSHLLRISVKDMSIIIQKKLQIVSIYHKLKTKTQQSPSHMILTG